MHAKALREGYRLDAVAAFLAPRRARLARCAAFIFGLALIVWLPLGGSPAQAEEGDLFKGQNGKNETNQPLLLQADELVYDRANQRTIAKGNVEVYYKNYALLADSLIYDQRANTLNAFGNVRIKEPDGSLINADRITLTDDFRDGFIRSFKVVTKTEARIAASNAYRKDGKTTVFERGVFTPCKQCENDPDAPPIWRIKARKVIHKKDEGNVYFEDAAFEMFGMPVIWVPYFYYPDPTVKRRSGFLTPEFGHSQDLGFTAGVPYFYALSPSSDLTITPVMTTEAGFLLKAEWRQRLRTGSYKIKAAGVYDGDPDDPTREDNEFRGSIQTQGEFGLGTWWKWGWDITVESDDTFRRFYKIDNVFATDRISTVYLVGQSDRNYFSANLYHFGGLTTEDEAEAFTDEKADSIVYPSVDYNYIYADPILGGELSYDANVLALSRDDGGDVARIINQAKWRRQFTDPLGQVITPFLQARADLYKTTSFTDPIDPDPQDGTTAFRGSAAAGLEYRYPFVKHSESATHVVEPIGQIIARPEIEDQGDIPNEDARSLVFDDTLLFDIDKFSGYDRIETGTRANVGVQYSVNTMQGWNARVVAGQSFQIDGDNPFAEDTGLSETQSDYVLGAYFDLSRNLQLVSQVRFDENDLELKRHDLQLSSYYGPFYASANYVNAQAQPSLGFDEDREEIAGLAAIRIANHWTIFGDLRYDLDSDEILRDSIGLKYSDECFMLSVSYAETNVQDGEIQPDQTVLVRYNLLTLGETGSRTDTIGTFSSQLPILK